jgi:hypothetical protein
MPFKDALADVCRQAHTELELDVEGLKREGVPTDLPITVSFKNERLDWALPRLLHALDACAASPSLECGRG